MVTSNIAVVKTTTITPESSFVKTITVEGTNVNVKLQNDRIYHYEVSPELAKQIIKQAKDKKSMGKVFNKWLRGNSVAKTILA
jgi:hypothetical protein